LGRICKFPQKIFTKSGGLIIKEKILRFNEKKFFERFDLLGLVAVTNPPELIRNRTGRLNDCCSGFAVRYERGLRAKRLVGFCATHLPGLC
jgi:hypothetical protein